MKRPILNGYFIAVKLDGHDVMIYPECYMDYFEALHAIKKRYSIDVIRRMAEEDSTEWIEVWCYEGGEVFDRDYVYPSDYTDHQPSMARYEKEDETKIDY